MNLDRRTLLIGGGAGIGLVVAYALLPRGLGGSLDLRDDETGFGAFLKIAASGTVSVAVPQIETGQGIWTALPQIVADELGADWRTVAVEPAPLAKVYANALASEGGWFDGLGRLRAFQFPGSDKAVITAGSTSVRAFAEPMRLAAATARTLLIAAAAARWGIAAEDCVAANGLVSAGGRSLGFGALAEDAGGMRVPSALSLRSGEKGRLLGQSLPRLDGPAKAKGAFRFAGDVRLPDMLRASVRIAPVGGRLTGFERSTVAGRDGVRHLAARDDWIAIAADSLFIAERALHAAKPRFEAPAEWADPRAAFDAALALGGGTVVHEFGDVDAAVGSARPFAATYYVAPLPNLLPEPLSATARWSGGAAELWSGTQAPGLAAAGAARDKGLALYPMPVGGASGRLENRLERIALDLAAELKRPVQVTLPQSAARWASVSTPGMMAGLSALLRRDGFPISWDVAIATGNGMIASLARLAGSAAPASLDRSAIGNAASPYGIENVRVTAIDVRPPFATGYVRGSPERETVFATESFIDEMARHKALEPLAFRMAMLGADPRLARCFQLAAARAEWDGGGAGSNMGIAGTSAFGSSIALVATASIGSDQTVEAHKLVAAVDCGAVINPALAAQQVEAALMWALAAAGGGKRGIIKAPEIEVHFLPSTAPIGGLSGLGTLPLAPAIANAIHAATGKRMRSLPFDPMGA
ncbi:MAG: molybdopterin cofactor-binding domain-containing protein [Sphingomicrobium sp.]